MKLKTMFASAAISTALALCAVQADATTLKFTLTGADNYSWLQDSAPTPTVSSDGLGTTVSVWDSVGASFNQVSYLNGDNAGGVAADEVFGAFFGPQVYSGSEAAPLFAVTTTPLVYQFSLSTGFTPDSLTISAVPEPAVWLLMFAGLGMLGGALRLRRGKGAALAV